MVQAVKGWKRHGGQKLAAGQRGEPKEMTQGDCRSWRKFAAACRKASRHTRVKGRKRNVFRKIWTQGNCGPQNELAAAGKMAQSTKVAWLRGHDRKKYDQHNVVQETQKERTIGKRCWKDPECNNGIWDRGLRQQANKGPRWQAATMSEETEDNHKRHRRVELRTEIASGKWRKALEDPI
jgi:hypothetical protein